MCCFALPGIIVRSSVWLGLPNIIDHISVANSTDVWPEVFCVGSAVRTALFPPVQRADSSVRPCVSLELEKGMTRSCAMLKNPDSTDKRAHSLKCLISKHVRKQVTVTRNQNYYKCDLHDKNAASNLCVTDVDPVVFQCFLLVDLLLCCGRLPGGENICRNQVLGASPSIHSDSLSPQHLRAVKV